MDSVKEALVSKLPTVWINTQDVFRVINKICKNSQQQVYRLNPFDGLITYVDSVWKIILIEKKDALTGENVYSTIDDVDAAISYVYSHNGLLIIPNADLHAEKLADILPSFQEDYRSAFMTDDINHISASIYFISSVDNVPETYGRNMHIINDSLPTIKDIDVIYDSIHSISAESVGSKDNYEKLSKNSLGLTESEIITSSLQLIQTKGEIPFEDMNDARTKYLKARNIDLIKSDITFDDLGGMDIAKEIITHSAKLFQSKQKDVTPMSKLLLIGVPGCGKSALCKATANHLNLQLARTGVSHQMSKWIGESERNMRETLASIFAMSPICLWIDELARDLSGSGSSNDGGTTDRVHGEFLTGLQEMPSNVFLMAAANRVHGLPPEMLRQGRFDEILFVGFPSTAERAKIFSIYLKEDINQFDVLALAKATEGFTGAEIESLIKKFRFSSSAGYGNSDTETLLSLISSSRNLVIIRHANEIIDMYNRAQYSWQWASSEQRIDAERVINGTFGPLNQMNLGQPKATKSSKTQHAKAISF